MVKMNRYLFSRIKGVLVVAVALLLCNSCAANEVLLSPQDVIMSSEITFSSGYTCKPAAIVSQAFRDSVYFHMIVGTDHAASTTLLTHRLCFAMQMGIKVRPLSKVFTAVKLLLPHSHSLRLCVSYNTPHTGGKHQTHSAALKSGY
jgi:hypothetical protein